MAVLSGPLVHGLDCLFDDGGHRVGVRIGQVRASVERRDVRVCPRRHGSLRVWRDDLVAAADEVPRWDCLPRRVLRRRYSSIRGRGGVEVEPAPSRSACPSAALDRSCDGASQCRGADCQAGMLDIGHVLSVAVTRVAPAVIAVMFVDSTVRVIDAGWYANTC